MNLDKISIQPLETTFDGAKETGLFGRIREVAFNAREKFSNWVSLADRDDSMDNRHDLMDAYFGIRAGRYNRNITSWARELLAFPGTSFHAVLDYGVTVPLSAEPGVDSQSQMVISVKSQLTNFLKNAVDELNLQEV